MDMLTQKAIQSLVHHTDASCLSIYIPAHRTGKEVKQDPIRLKNMIRQAETYLSESHAEPFQRLTEPVRALIESRDFRNMGCEGLGVFRSGDLFRWFCLPNAFCEIGVVADHFHVKPLVPIIDDLKSYFLLSLHQHGVHFYLGNRFRLQEIDLPGLPRHIQDVLQYDDPERQVQFHTGTARPSGRRAAMFHGQGVGVDDHKSNIKRFFQEVSRVVSPYVEERKAPLIVASLESLFPIYREVNTASRLKNEFIDCHPQSQSESELMKRASGILATRAENRKREAVDRYHALQPSKTSDAIENVAPLAVEGRIEILFADLARFYWGRCDLSEEHIEIHEQREAGDVDLLNLTVVHTLRHGGRVIPMTGEDVPGDTPVAAVLKG